MKYLQLFFAQDWNAYEYLTYLDEEGESNTLDYILSQLSTEEGEVFDSHLWGTEDYVYESHPYILAYNLSKNYISLSKEINE